MKEDLLNCPNCGHEFQMSDALTGKLREHLKAELEKDVARREALLKKEVRDLKEQQATLAKTQETLDEQVEAKVKERSTELQKAAEQKVDKKYADQLKELQETVSERDAAISGFQEQERELRKKQRELELAKESMDLEIDRKVDAEREKLRQEAEKKIKSKYTSQVSELQQSLDERETAIKGLRDQEVELRKKQRLLEVAKEEAELEVARKIDEERGRIREEVEMKSAEAHRLKDLEKEKIINDLKVSLDDMKRRAEQGSMETQGEVLEQDFESQLRAFFPHDDIQPVPKGIRGADLIQMVRTPLGVECGVLLWEAKNTKAWNDQWITKLKDDMIETRATVAILVSVALPDALGRFGLREGVWVSEPLSAIPLAVALREQLVVVNRERSASVGKNEKMETLYQYLAGSEFKQKIEGIVEAFTSMQEQLNQERRAMERHWKQREKQIQRVVKNTVGLYGDMQGIIGGHIPSIPALELDGDEVRKLPDNTDAKESDEASADLEKEAPF